MKNAMKLSFKSIKRSVQRGFGIVEVVIVIAILAVLGAVGAPYVNEIIIEGRAAPTADDFVKVTSKLRANFSGQGNTPYAGMNTAIFSNTANRLAVAMEVAGTGATATTQHRVGLTGSQVTAAPATVTTLGDSYNVTVPTVNRVACAPLAAGLARAALRITINGTTVKALNGTYNGGAALNACTNADTNAMVFTFN